MVELYVENDLVVKKCELAFDFFTRFKGLMFRKKSNFVSGQGMLFDNCSSIHMFFMRFPIDVVYMDKHFNILKIEKNLKINHFSFGPKGTFYTLELPIGESEKFEVGKNVYIK